VNGIGAWGSQWHWREGESVALARGGVSGTGAWGSQWHRRVGESVALARGGVSGTGAWGSQWQRAAGPASSDASLSASSAEFTSHQGANPK